MTLEGNGLASQMKISPTDKLVPTASSSISWSILEKLKILSIIVAYQA